MKKLSNKKMAGFSVVEALVAALVVGIGVAGVAKLQGDLFQGGAKTRVQTQASNSAQEKIEELRNNDYRNLANGSYSDTVAANSTNLNRTWVINDCANRVNCKDINVMVAWVDGENKPQQINLTSQIGNLQPEKSGIAFARANNPNGGSGGGGTNGPGTPDDGCTSSGSTTNSGDDGKSSGDSKSEDTGNSDGTHDNKGHGNNLDGQDDDNPGQGSGGPNAAPKDGVDEDEGAKGNQGGSISSSGDDSKSSSGDDSKSGSGDDSKSGSGDDSKSGSGDDSKSGSGDDSKSSSSESSGCKSGANTTSEDSSKSEDDTKSSEDSSKSETDTTKSSEDSSKSEDDTKSSEDSTKSSEDSNGSSGTQDNNGHGNNLDGQDDSNPGQGGGGPNAAPKDGVDEDEGAKGNQDSSGNGASGSANTVTPANTGIGQTPASYTLSEPSGCGASANPCTFDRGAKDGESIKLSFKDALGKAVTATSADITVSIPEISLPAKQLQPSVVGGVSVKDGAVSFKVRGPGCCATGDWVGVQNKAFTVQVSVYGVPFSIYMKTDK